MKKILFIVNPISGVGRQNKIEKVIQENLDIEQFSYEIRYTQCIHDGTRIAHEAVSEGVFDAVIAVGGDGSINDVVAGMKDSNIPMGIVPCGSGNGLARNLKVPLNPPLAIKVINNFHVEPIDTISVNDYTYASIAGVGFDALVARRMKLAKSRGLRAYVDIVLTDYPTSQEHKFQMTVDGVDMEREAWFISLANSNQFGFETKVAPTAKLDDGLIDICIVKKIPLVHLPLTLPLIYLNHFQYSQHVEIMKAKEVIIHNNDYKWINIDGEGEIVGTELYFKNNPQSLNIICPEDYRERPAILEQLEKDMRTLIDKI